ncbi:MAG: histidinol-phosphate transaminase [Chloroflexi bacterium]|nr:MAG: histidinol-phosphate transaminase [Chloroflexota bacterium]
MSHLHLNPNVSASPIYVGGASIADIRAQVGRDDIAKLASNESPLGPSPKAVAAMQAAISELNRYPPIADDALRAALARVNGHGLSPDNFITGNGGCDVLDMLATSFLDSGSEAIICRPTFPMYDITARRAGAGVVYVDLLADDFLYDVEAILSAVTERTRLVYVCSPNNPTGSILPAAQMDTLVEHLPPHVLLVADEVYHHFATHPEFSDSLEYVRQGKNVLVLHSFSKAYGLAGLRLGYGVAPVEIAQYLSRAKLPFHLNQMTLSGALAALDDADYLENTVKLVVAGREYLHSALAEIEDVQVWPSQANFVLFKPAFDAAEVSARLLQHGLIVRPMGQFYLPTHLRVSVGLPEENERFVTALRDVLAGLVAEGAEKADTAGQKKEGGAFKF